MLHFKNENDKAKAEKVGAWLIDNYGFEWISEESDLFTVGIENWTIAELREVYKQAKDYIK